jgi:hypothetical protein
MVFWSAELSPLINYSLKANPPPTTAQHHGPNCDLEPSFYATSFEELHSAKSDYWLDF